MARYEIFHNPRCGKSRQTLARLTEAGIAPVVVEYLVAPPTKTRLQEIVSLLGFADPRQLMRTKEPVYASLGLAGVPGSLMVRPGQAGGTFGAATVVPLPDPVLKMGQT